ncbi:MAG: hypothetical protein JWM12_490 [Ilumatobacteraceae bacterium]|jgi:anti-sigma regulatory factor (Ser/Thr protein kinase)|nr:hypothetical protein [Ilumatobacteraceae bacterium]
MGPRVVAGAAPVGSGRLTVDASGYRPTVASRGIELQLDDDTRSTRAVRRAVAAHFATSSRLDDLLLCVSEVVTNAVLHAERPIRVVAETTNGGIRVEVTDCSDVMPVRRSPDDHSPTGRGLLLLDALTSEWGVEPALNGKTVWFVIEGAPA